MLSHETERFTFPVVIDTIQWLVGMGFPILPSEPIVSGYSGGGRAGLSPASPARKSSLRRAFTSLSPSPGLTIPNVDATVQRSLIAGQVEGWDRARAQEKHSKTIGRVPSYSLGC